MDRVMCWNFRYGGVEAARADGFTEEELERLEDCVRRRYANELNHRLMAIPAEVRQRIVRNVDLEAFIPIFCDKEATLGGYFLLPIHDAVEPSLLHVLIIPPLAAEWGIVRRNCSCELLRWLKEPVPGQALGWITTMLEEFCAQSGLQSQWHIPRVDGSMASIREYAEFRKCLQCAQQCEANLRLASATNWLEERGMDGLVDSSVYAVMRDATDDYDPEHSVFVFPFRLKGKLCSLILLPAGHPFFCLQPFDEVKRIASVENCSRQQAWLNAIKLSGSHNG